MIAKTIDTGDNLEVRRIGRKVKLVMKLANAPKRVEESITELTSFAQGRLMISKIRARGWVNLECWTTHDVDNWDEHCNAQSRVTPNPLGLRF